MHLRPLLSTIGIPLSSWQVQVPCTKSQIQHFCSLLGSANTFSFLYLPLKPHQRVFLKCSSSFTLILSASLSLISTLSFISVLYPPNFSMDSISSWSPPTCISLYFLDYTVPPYSSLPFCYFLPYSPISYGWQPLFWHVPYTAISTFSRLYLFQMGICLLYTSPSPRDKRQSRMPSSA